MKVFYFIFVLLSFGANVISSRKEMKFDFRNDIQPIYIPQGDTLKLYCNTDTSSLIQVYDRKHFRRLIVAESELQQEFSEQYDFQVVDTDTALFTIKELTPQLNDTIFVCDFVKQLYIHIIVFNPIEETDPVCSSTYGSRYIFDDSIESDIQMNCTSQEGDPPVTMSTYIRHGGEINDVTNMSRKVESFHQFSSKTLSFSSYFNSSFNNSIFVCDVFQYLPASYQNYHGSCTFGPILFMSVFSVSVTPSVITVSDTDTFILTCSSNVSDVYLTWTNIPYDWDTQVKNGYGFSQVNIIDIGSAVNLVDVNCVGYYGDRNISVIVHINVSKSRTKNAGVVIGILVAVFVILAIIASLVVGIYKKSLKSSLDEQNVSDDNQL